MAIESSSPTSRAVLAGVALALVLGAALRGAYLHDLRRDPLFRKPVLDAELHDYWAHALATGDWTVPKGRHDPEIRTTPYFRPPGYPFVLAAFDLLTGSDPVGVRIIQFGIGLLTVLLGFLLGRKLAGPLAGVVAAFGLAVSWPLIFFEGELLDSCVLAATILAVLLLLERAASRATPLSGLLAGVFVGAAALVRPNVLAFAPVAVLWVLWAGSRRSGAGPARRAALALVAGVVLAVAPATIRNRVVSGQWVLISANGGINLRIGNNPEADGIHAAIPEIESLADLSGWTCFDYPALVSGLARRVGHPLDYAEASRVWAAEAWRWIAAHPLRFAALTAKRTALFFGPAEIGDRDVDLAREASPVLSRIPGRFPWVLATALVGLALVLSTAPDRSDARRTARPQAELAILIVGFVASYSASFLVFFFNSRYRVPVLAALYPPAGAAIAWMVARAREGRRLRALGAAGAAVGLAAILSVDFVGVRHPRDEWHYQRASAYRNGGDLADAIREYEEAIQINPRYTMARNDLGVILRSEGRVTEAVDEWNTALRSDPHAVEPRFNLAQTLAAAGRYAEAITAYREVLAERPGHARAHLSLGTALVQTGRATEGWDEYARARELAPDDPLVAYVVGRSLVARGRRDEGIAELQRALRLDPGNRTTAGALAAARAGRPVASGEGR